MKLQAWAFALVAPSITAATEQQCVPGLHIIVARGSLEPPGEGTLGTVAYAVTSQISEYSDSVGLNYPAGLHPYRGSVVNGTAALTALVEQYQKQCPQGKIALMGYSQGAQVVGNTLCGTSSHGWEPTPPLPKQYAENIVAIAMTGDPTFIPNLPYDVGTSTKEGKFPRRDIQACLPYAKRMHSWCDMNDKYCAHGNSLAVHLNYTYRYSTAIAEFLLKTYEDTPPLNPFPSPSPSSKSHPTPSHSASSHSAPSHSTPSHSVQSHSASPQSAQSHSASSHPKSSHSAALGSSHGSSEGSSQSTAPAGSSSGGASPTNTAASDSSKSPSAARRNSESKSWQSLIGLILAVAGLV